MQAYHVHVLSYVRLDKFRLPVKAQYTVNVLK